MSERKEDNILKTLVEKMGIKKWTEISRILNDQYSIGHRNGKQCRERYLNHLATGLRKGDWSIEEDEKLLKLHDLVGNRWADISHQFDGRTDNCVKNQLYSKLRKSLRYINETSEKHFKKKSKPLRVAFIYKLIEMADQRYKQKSIVKRQASEESFQLKKQILELERITAHYIRIDETNYFDQQEYTNRVRQLYQKINNFNKKYKKRIPKQRLFIGKKQRLNQLKNEEDEQNENIDHLLMQEEEDDQMQDESQNQVVKEPQFKMQQEEKRKAEHIDTKVNEAAKFQQAFLMPDSIPEMKEKEEKFSRLSIQAKSDNDSRPFNLSQKSSLNAQGNFQYFSGEKQYEKQPGQFLDGFEFQNNMQYLNPNRAADQSKIAPSTFAGSSFFNFSQAQQSMAFTSPNSSIHHIVMPAAYTPPESPHNSSSSSALRVLSKPSSQSIVSLGSSSNNRQASHICKLHSLSIQKQPGFKQIIEEQRGQQSNGQFDLLDKTATFIKDQFLSSNQKGVKKKRDRKASTGSDVDVQNLHFSTSIGEDKSAQTVQKNPLFINSRDKKSLDELFSRVDPYIHGEKQQKKHLALKRGGNSCKQSIGRQKDGECPQQDDLIPNILVNGQIVEQGKAKESQPARLRSFGSIQASYQLKNSQQPKSSTFEKTYLDSEEVENWFSNFQT